jgi:5'-deoxynucleotidase YfbR-like HD superfamily hydrolase
MQPIDPEDKRQSNVQVAASIRAAILTGELTPGSRLLANHDLAEFFGVSRSTVQKAIDTLREEGFVRSRTGSGVYVLDQASLPVPAGEDHRLAGAAAFLYEMGQLKNIPRNGWLRLGIRQGESVADHSFRGAMVGITLAAMAGADVGRTAALCVFHDGHEARIGDVDAVGRAYVTTAIPEAVTAHQTSGMPDEAAKALQDLTAEYEANETPEARLAHDADKIETILQAREYQAQGYDTAPWRENSAAALRTKEGQELAQAINATAPTHWIKAFDASYAELRATTRARQRRAADQ